MVADFFYAWISNMVLAPTNELNILLFYIRKQLFYRKKLGLAVKHLIVTITNIVLLGDLIYTWIYDLTHFIYLYHSPS